MTIEPILNNSEGKILAIYPNKNGFSYAYFDSPRDLIDWGNIYLKSDQLDKNLQRLIDTFKPEVIITEDHKGSGYRRGKRMTSKLEAIYKQTEQSNIFLKKYSASMVKGVFDCFEAHNKHAVATLLAIWYRQLETKLPPKPKAWSDIHHNFPIFDAVSLAFVYFYTEAN